MRLVRAQISVACAIKVFTHIKRKTEFTSAFKNVQEQVSSRMRIIGDALARRKSVLETTYHAKVSMGATAAVMAVLDLVRNSVINAKKVSSR